MFNTPLQKQISSYLAFLSVLKSIYFWVGSWSLFLAMYAISMHYDISENHWDGIVCLIQIICDVLIGLFGYLSFKLRNGSIEKQFYLGIFISLIPGLFANEIYNILINVFGITNIDASINKSWVIAYTLFLIIQIFTWIFLYFKKQEKLTSENKSWSVKLPYIQSAVIVIISLVLMVYFRNTIIREIGITGSVNSGLEIILYVILSISLAKTKNRSLNYLETGFLLLIAFNLAHRFSYTTGNYFKAFDTAWLLSLIIIIYGLIASWHEKKKPIEFYPDNSIHVLSSSIFICFSTFILILFVVFDFAITSMELNRSAVANILPQNIPSILIFSYSASLLVGKYVADYLSRPLESISHRVDKTYLNGFDEKMLEKKFNIEEIDKLDKFILKNINELKIANQVKSDFLMNISHDFKTPASGIYYLSKVIYEQSNDATLKESLKYVVESSEQLIKFIDDVLDYSRLDRNQFNVTPSNVNINELIEELILFVAAEAKDKNIFIQAEFKENDIKYFGDRLILHRILLNIISNAIKFTQQGGVTILVSRDFFEGQVWLVIKVKDTGIGIEPEFHKTIFDPFIRLDSSRTAKTPGIGLGLNNVNLMVKLLKGYILLDSQLNKGSTFTLYLPNDDYLSQELD